MTAHLFKVVGLRDDVTQSGMSCGDGAAYDLLTAAPARSCWARSSRPLGALRRRACATVYHYLPTCGEVGVESSRYSNKAANLRK
jgi:hypothetical protein